jgi:hypothetical protein
LFVLNDSNKSHYASFAPFIQPRHPERLFVLKQKEGCISIGAIIRVVLIVRDRMPTRRKQHLLPNVVHRAPVVWYGNGSQFIRHRSHISFLYFSEYGGALFQKGALSMAFMLTPYCAQPKRIFGYRRRQ